MDSQNKVHTVGSRQMCSLEEATRALLEQGSDSDTIQDAVMVMRKRMELLNSENRISRDLLERLSIVPSPARQIDGPDFGR